MGVSGEDAVRYAEETAEELVPVFEEKYGVDLMMPTFKGTRLGYCDFGTAMEYRPPHRTDVPAGIVEVREDTNWSITGIRGRTGHELGHAALYQNSDFGELREDNERDWYLLSSISEGIAQQFQDDTFRYYLNGGGTNTLEKLDYLTRRGIGNSIRGMIDVAYTAAETVTGDLWRSDFSYGRSLFRGSDKGEVVSVLTDPEALYQQVADKPEQV